MAERRKPKQQKTFIAQVFLRSVSGRSLRELTSADLPMDFSPFHPPSDARATTWRYLEKAGFKIFSEDLTQTISIEAPARLFTKIFGISHSELENAGAIDSVRLRAPAEIAGLVDEIILTPKPEMF